MAKEKWGPSGIAHPHDRRLPELARETIETLLVAKAFPRAAIEMCVIELDNAFRQYFSIRELQENSSPGVMRANLKAAFAAAKENVTRIEELDQNSKFLVDAATGVRGWSGLREQADKIVHALHKALQNVPNHPAGRLRDYPMDVMALHTRYAVERHLGVNATTTKPSRAGPVFNDMLSEMVAAVKSTLATEKGERWFDPDYKPDVHKLARRAVRGEILEYDGTLPEFIVAQD